MLKAMVVGGVGLALVVGEGGAQESGLPGDVLPALEATLGNLLFLKGGGRQPVTVTEYQSRFYPALRFWVGAIVGEHGRQARGLAVRLPGGAAVPLESPGMRRLLSAWAVIDTSDAAALVEYAAELAWMEGRLGIAPARVVTGLSDLPPDAQVRAREVGTVPSAPVLEPRGGGSTVAFWMASEAGLIRVSVFIGSERFRDGVITVEPAMGF